MSRPVGQCRGSRDRDVLGVGRGVGRKGRKMK